MKTKIIHPTPDPCHVSEASRPGMQSLLFLLVVGAGITLVAFGKQLAAAFGLG